MGCCGTKVLKPHTYSVWQTAAAHGDPPRKVFVIVNPYSGGKTGMQIFERVKSVLEAGGVAVSHAPTERAGHATQLAQEADLTGVDVVCTVGGDGTVHEAVNGLMVRRGGVPEGLRLGVIPAGSGNTFAYDLGICSAEQAAQCILSGQSKHIDLLRVATPPPGELGASSAAPAQGQSSREPLQDGGRHGADAAAGSVQYSLNMIGFGVPAAVLRRANSLRCCGGAQYNCAAYCELISNPAYPVRLHVRGRTAGITDEELRGLASSQQYAMMQMQLTVHMGEKVPLCTGAKLDDGLMDVLLIPHGGRLQLAGVMEKAKGGTHLSGLGFRQPTNVKYFQCEGLTLEPEARCSGPDTVNVDGELCQSSPFTVTCVPKALCVITPSGAAAAPAQQAPGAVPAAPPPEVVAAVPARAAGSPRLAQRRPPARAGQPDAGGRGVILAVGRL